MTNPKSQNQPPHILLLSIVLAPVLQPRSQLLSQATRLQPLHGYIVLPPPTLLERALVRLLWQAAGVSMLEERSSACLPRLWEKRPRGDGHWEWVCGHAVGYSWTAPGAVLCTPICSMCVQTLLCIMLICNYNKRLNVASFFFFFLVYLVQVPAE